MAADIGSSGQPLERLSIELHRLILLELDDIGSLGCAILSCHALHSAFSINPGVIATQVLVNQVGCDVLPEAIAAFESSRAGAEKDDFVGFMAQHVYRRSVCSISATPAEAASFAKLDVCSRQLVHMFANDCLAEVPTPKAEEDVADQSSDVSLAPTPSERARIRRALYRFETFCNIARRILPGVFYPDTRLDSFCSRFSPWENEQVGCIQDFLFRLVSPGEF